MIRRAKPIRLYEWGEGTNTLNQIWTQIGEGKIVQVKSVAGQTTLTIECRQPVHKKNTNDKSIKLMQEGEGMTARSDRWGEVAMGQIKGPGGSSVEVEILTAIKIDNRKSLN
jgi:hypothetical protein